MTVRRWFFRAAAILLTVLLVYVWFGVAYLADAFQPWVYRLLS